MTCTSKLIVGCGYLGRRVARRWRAAGQLVVGVTRHAQQAQQLATENIQPLLADVTRPETLRHLPPAETVLFSVGYDPDSGTSRQAVFVDGLRAVLDALAPDTRRVIFISSTGVYGPAGGGWVDEDTPCRPTREAGRTLLAAEQLLAAHPQGRRAIVLRLAGIYGPGRLPRTADLASGRPLAVADGGWVNLIHVEDAAAVVLAAEALATPPRTYLVADGCPVLRRDYLRELASLLGLPAPRFADSSPQPAPGQRGAGDKRVSNARLMKELGIRLTYPSFREGLAASWKAGQ